MEPRAEPRDPPTSPRKHIKGKLAETNYGRAGGLADGPRPSIRTVSHMMLLSSRVQLGTLAANKRAGTSNKIITKNIILHKVISFILTPDLT